VSQCSLVDAHVHLDPNSRFYTPGPALKDLLARMDMLGVAKAVCSDHLSLYAGAGAGLVSMRRLFETSGGRLFFLGVYHPRKPSECLLLLEKAVRWEGFAGIKIHPSFHGVPAEDSSYRPIWEFASEHRLPVLTHSWSVSEHNPTQSFSLPGRFEGYIGEFSSVKCILAHTGGRGNGRAELIRIINRYKNAYTDIAGDIYCNRLIETLTSSVPSDRVLFGSDFPWLDPRSNLTRVLLADVSDEVKEKILRNNALEVYGLENR